MKPVAYISERVVNMLHLPISPGTPVFIGESNIEHIKKRHPYEYEKYMPDIGSIIKQENPGNSAFPGSFLHISTRPGRALHWQPSRSPRYSRRPRNCPPYRNALQRRRCYDRYLP